MLVETQNDNTVARITDLVKCLATEQQEELEKELQKLIVAMADELKKTVKPNSNEFNKIMSEVEMAKEKAAKKKDK